MSEAPAGRPGRAISSLLILAVGLLLGRLSAQLPEAASGLVNLFIAALIAVSVTMMWRRWARRTVERRRREQRERRERADRAAKQP
ncbi:MAG: hypothetical protein EPO16_11690 [Dehalococcoidia bacterium]|nr:MAG: hypothetical protein EPO16_11690 [Dehalococcoidia bacterium]